MPSQITFDVAVLLEVCAAIVAVGAAVVYIRKAIKPLFKPVEELVQRIEALEEKQKTCQSYFTNDKHRLDAHERMMQRQANDNIIMLESVALLMKHAETGNNTGEVAEGRENLEKYLINRK